jgi:hypothetical protein
MYRQRCQDANEKKTLTTTIEPESAEIGRQIRLGLPQTFQRRPALWFLPARESRTLVAPAERFKQPRIDPLPQAIRQGVESGAIK